MTDTAMHDRGELEASNAAAAKANDLLHGNINDIDRMTVAAQLVNTFNLAILKQAKRPNWNAQDMRAFSVALTAVNMIGAMDTPPQQQGQPQGEDETQGDTFESLEAEVANLGERSAVEYREEQQHRTQMPPGPGFGGAPGGFGQGPRVAVARRG